MKAIFLTLAAIACMEMPSLSRADWVDLSAAAKCDTSSGLFSLVPAAETSDPGTRIAIPEGFTEFPDKLKQRFHCKLGKTSILLVFSRYAPNGTGMGRAAGVMRIESLTIDGKDVLKPTDFFWQVMSERILTRITVRVHGTVVETTYCYSDGFDWFVPGFVKDLKCQKERQADGS